MNVKTWWGSSTTIWWRSSSRLRSSSAAVRPAKLDPSTTTRWEGEEGMVDLLPLHILVYNCVVVYERRVPLALSVVNYTTIKW